MKTKELQERTVEAMRRWQGIEERAIQITEDLLGETENPIIRQVLAIIQQDSRTHARVQQLIADTLEGQAISLNPDEVAGISDALDRHGRIEEETVALARETLSALKGKKMLVQEYLLDYLLQDEEKHVALLKGLDGIKRGMYPYA